MNKDIEKEMQCARHTGGYLKAMLKAGLIRDLGTVDREVGNSIRDVCIRFQSLSLVCPASLYLKLFSNRDTLYMTLYPKVLEFLN